jgi:hypothetical protein
MKFSHVGRSGALMTVVFAFAGCGYQITPTGGAPQSPTAAMPGKSWMLPEAKGDDLLYVSVNWPPTGAVNVFTFPNETFVGQLTGFSDQASSLCADSAGNVFVDTSEDGSYDSSIIYEYAHGGTSPIGTLSLPGVAYSCSVDPMTGNLAEVGDTENNPYAYVWVFAGAKGNPKAYDTSKFSLWNCSYDDRGNLYLSVYDIQSLDFVLARLARGSNSIRAIDLNAKLYSWMLFSPWVQWDGQHMTVSSYPSAHQGGVIFLYRLSISGRRATVIGTTELKSPEDNTQEQTWIHGKYLAGIYHHHGSGYAGLWSYPQGGLPLHGVKATGDPEISDVTVSLASHH